MHAFAMKSQYWTLSLPYVVDDVTCLLMAADAPATTSASVPSSKVCPQCGTIKKTGKLSCCARGGSWFNNCGDAGDSNIAHTWGEGVQACTSKLARYGRLCKRDESILVRRAVLALCDDFAVLSGVGVGISI